MADNIDSDDSAPRSTLGRKLAMAAAALAVLLVVLYFVASSSAFLKGVILPRVSKSLNSEITVGDASLSPFSQVTLQKLKVQSAGMEPLLVADEVRVRYSLMSILRGNYVVDELNLVSPVIQIIQEPSGKSNLDPLIQGPPSSSSGARSEGPLRISIRNVSVKDGLVRKVEKARDGGVKTVELGQLNVGVDRLENGGSGKLTLATTFKADHRAAPNTPGTNDVLEGKMNGNFEFKLDQKLLPQSVTGNAGTSFSRAEGAYAEVAGLGSTFQADVTPTEIRQLAVRFERGGQGLGRIQASGPLDLSKLEGRLKVEVQSIDRQVLNVFGAGRGWDFGGSTLNATNVVDIAQRGEVLGARGQVAVRQFSVKQQGLTTPAVDLDVDYDVTVNQHDRSAVVRTLNLTGQQQTRPFLRASLDKPMTLTWAANVRGMVDSVFQLALTQVNLGDWQPILGTNLPSGRLDWELSVTAKDDAKSLTVQSTATVQDLAAKIGTNQLNQAGAKLVIKGKLENFKTVTLDAWNLEVQQLKQPLVKANGTAHFEFSAANLNLQANAEVALPAMLRQFPTAGVTAAKGLIRLSAAVTQARQRYSATGNLIVGDFTGTCGSYAFEDYQTALDYNLDFERPALQVRSATVTLRQGYSAGGSISLNGDYNLDRSSGQLTFRLVDLNEHALAPLLAASLGDKKLVSISLSGGGSSSYDPKGETAVKADVSLTNWVVAAPGFVSPKLGAQVQLDASMRQSVLDLRQFVLKLAPTAKAANELQAKAHLDFTPTNSTPSQLTVAADSLDLTPYYDLFAGKTATNPPAAQPVAAAPSAAVPGVKPVEPEPAKLPFRQFNGDVKVARLFLRELVMSNFQAVATVNGQEVSVKPVALTLNQAPVTASALLNLGVAGYTYDVSFKADRVPIEPLSNTFTTNAPGTYKGDLYAQAQLKGAGVTGPSLQKNLNGSLSLNMTNMSYEIVGRKAKRLLEPIALALQVPELVQTPLNWIGAKIDVGKGQIDLQQFDVQSQAFSAQAHGIIPMAELLTNSPLNKLPVNLSLRRSIAEKANLLAANTPTNAVYAPLPTFVTLTGTLGDPKSEINKVVIAGLLARSIGGLVPMGDKASTLLQGLGGVLSGQTGAAARTNAPASTNAAANIVQSITGLLDQSKKTNSAAGSNTNKPAKFNPFDLLKTPAKK